MIVGFDKEFVYIHNPGPLNPESFMKIERVLFDKSRKSTGTDEDIVFVHRKH